MAERALVRVQCIHRAELDAQTCATRASMITACASTTTASRGDRRQRRWSSDRRRALSLLHAPLCQLKGGS